MHKSLWRQKRFMFNWMLIEANIYALTIVLHLDQMTVFRLAQTQDFMAILSASKFVFKTVK